MKVYIFSIALFLISNMSLAGNERPHSKWIETNTVFISNGQSPEAARRDCEITMQILGIMSNNKVVFETRCEPANNPRCIYYYCYKLCTKVLVVD